MLRRSRFRGGALLPGAGALGLPKGGPSPQVPGGANFVTYSFHTTIQVDHVCKL